MMYYAQFRPYDVANGPGIRCSLFVSGCTHACPGCFNQDYQNFSYGKPWDSEAEKTLLHYLLQPEVSGLTLLGGEPLQNLPELTFLIERILLEIEQAEVSKTIWIYSGYTWEEIIEDEAKLTLVSLCDVLVDGLFIESKKDLMLKFRGSSNQRIIDIKASLSHSQSLSPILFYQDNI